MGEAKLGAKRRELNEALFPAGACRAFKGTGLKTAPAFLQKNGNDGHVAGGGRAVVRAALRP